MSDFLSMGGYAVYVWSAYGVAAVVMIVLLATSLRALRRQQQEVRLLEEARGRTRSESPPAAAVPESGR